jgi:hypothetical protein
MGIYWIDHPKTKSYLLNKKYLHKLIDDLPEVIQVGEDGFMFYEADGESVEVGKMGIVNEFSIFCPPWAVMRKD